MSVKEFTFFWKKESPFSQWHFSPFVYKGIKFLTAEHFMMYAKASLFGDEQAMQEVLKTLSPKEAKAIGRRVKNFDDKRWKGVCKHYVYVANREKFLQSPELLRALLDTQGTMLVEASPYDEIWGAGLKASDPGIQNPDNWPGTNWLGEVLTLLRDDILFGRSLGKWFNINDHRYAPCRKILDSLNDQEKAVYQLKGDLLDMAEQGCLDAFMHGCNCFCNMGAGIALGVKNRFYKAYEVDQETKKGDVNKLGTYTTAEEKGVTVINAYTQYGFGPKGQRAYDVRRGIFKEPHENDPKAVHADYEGMVEIFRKVNREFAGKKLGMPLIGAGLAGGDWDKIKSMAKREMPDVDLYIVFYHEAG